MKAGQWLALTLSALALEAHADVLPTRGHVDSRVRVAPYSPEEVYQLYAYVGYQIDLQFEDGESFVGLGAGDIEGISFVAEANHLFLKPKVPMVGTNLTVLTNRRQYQLDYVARGRRPDPELDEVIYSVRFIYPAPPKVAVDDSAERVQHALATAETARPHNIDYWFCGNPAVKPVAASDDGVHTRLRFGGRAEQPAIFVRNEDGSESLLNFSMDAGDIVIHRVAHRIILRRGKLTGCVINKAFNGGGERLESNTISPDVERARKGDPP